MVPRTLGTVYTNRKHHLLESFSLPFKRQMASDKYDVMRLHVHKLRKFQFS